jgi:hypothetical protein
MSNSPKPPRRTSPLWLAVGLAIGLVLAPAAAVAATIGAVKLVGADNVTAQVTRAGQLETAIAQPTLFRAFYDLNLGGSTCDTVYTAPSGYSLILEQVTIDVFADTTPGSGDTVSVATDDNCQNLLLDENPPSNGATVFPLGSGIVVPAGHSIYAIAKDNVEAEVYGYGYLVPVADAPSATQSTPGNVHLRGAYPRTNERQ